MDNPFWQYSLQVYRSAAVQTLCLELQDNHGANVNLLLWACWLETQGRALSADSLAQAMAQLAHWEQSVVRPLRQLRRALKAGHAWGQEDVEPTRALIKAAELKAEQQEQCWLYRRAQAVAEGVADNVFVYLKALEVPVAGDWLVRWRQALGAPPER